MNQMLEKLFFFFFCYKDLYTCLLRSAGVRGRCDLMCCKHSSADYKPRTEEIFIYAAAKLIPLKLSFTHMKGAA